MTIASNLLSRELRSKHIQGLVRAGEICILHVRTEDQRADILGKALWLKKFIVLHAVLLNLA